MPFCLWILKRKSNHYSVLIPLISVSENNRTKPPEFQITYALQYIISRCYSLYLHIMSLVLYYHSAVEMVACNSHYCLIWYMCVMVFFRHTL